MAVVILGHVDYVSYGPGLNPGDCPVVGNRQSNIYHVPGGHFYDAMLQPNKKGDNRECFKTADQAEASGFRRARR